MSVSSVAPGAASATTTNSILKDLKALEAALQKGDLSGAQTAFATFQKDLANSPGGTPGANTPAGKALAQLGAALQKGDLSGAQSAFAALVGGGRRHHRAHASGADSDGDNDGSGGSGGSGGSSQTAVQVPAQPSSAGLLNAQA